MADLNNGIKLWQEIADCLNDIIISTGRKIERDNPRIWGEHLHRYSNEDWQDLLAAYAEALDTAPDLRQNYRQSNLQRCQEILLRAKPGERPLDRKSKGGKIAAWAMINTLRETWNDIQGLDIPNQDAPKLKPRIRVETLTDQTRIVIWHDLFDINE